MVNKIFQGIADAFGCGGNSNSDKRLVEPKPVPRPQASPNAQPITSHVVKPRNPYQHQRHILQKYLPKAPVNEHTLNSVKMANPVVSCDDGASIHSVQLTIGLEPKPESYTVTRKLAQAPAPATVAPAPVSAAAPAPAKPAPVSLIPANEQFCKFYRTNVDYKRFHETVMPQFEARLAEYDKKKELYPKALKEEIHKAFAAQILTAKK